MNSSSCSLCKYVLVSWIFNNEIAIVINVGGQVLHASLISPLRLPPFTSISPTLLKSLLNPRGLLPVRSWQSLWARCCWRLLLCFTPCCANRAEAVGAKDNSHCEGCNGCIDRLGLGLVIWLSWMSIQSVVHGSGASPWLPVKVHVPLRTCPGSWDSVCSFVSFYELKRAARERLRRAW